MVDDFKSIRDSLFKLLTGSRAAATDDDEDAGGDGGERGSLLDARAAKALIGAIFTKAGKSKDEVVQIIAREIGAAVAAMLREPLSQLAKHQKLQISFEFVPKAGKTDGDAGGKRAVFRRTAAATKRSSRRKKADTHDR